MYFNNPNWHNAILKLVLTSLVVGDDFVLGLVKKGSAVYHTAHSIFVAISASEII